MKQKPYNLDNKKDREKLLKLAKEEIEEWKKFIKTLKKYE